MRPDTTVIAIRFPAGGARVNLERRGLHRFLVAYMAARGLLARPELRELLIAGVDVYPESFPAGVEALAHHLDRALGIASKEDVRRSGAAVVR